MIRLDIRQNFRPYPEHLETALPTVNGRLQLLPEIEVADQKLTLFATCRCGIPSLLLLDEAERVMVSFSSLALKCGQVNYYHSLFSLPRNTSTVDASIPTQSASTLARPLTSRRRQSRRSSSEYMLMMPISSTGETPRWISDAI